METLRTEFESLAWLSPWESTSSDFEVELESEVGKDHALFGQRAVSLARRSDCDDVLFYLPANALPLAVVRLTWSHNEGADFPRTTFYSSVNDWVERCMKPDHLAWA
jgi:hypothetical protein